MSVWEAGDNSKLLLLLPGSPLRGHWDGLLSHVVCTEENRGGKMLPLIKPAAFLSSDVLRFPLR